MKINKNKIVKYAASALLTASIAISAGGIYEASVNHDNEYCMLNHIFGLEHQANKINRGTNNFRYEAVYIPEGGLETIPYGFTEYRGYYNQHVIEYLSYYHGTFDLLKDGSVYAVNDGFLVENAIPRDERVEVYDYNAISDGPQLIRIFK